MPPEREPILPLPPEEVEKICAGEVVERPLSVVKELVENSLDAGARAISVELVDGGKALIRVSDDGGGIPADELALALRPHHTSKIRRLDDLFALHTLGFRGEALGAISAVARVALSSRYGAAPAMRIEAEGGVIGAPQPCNLQRGTEVDVRELFFNTPARRKFLRSAPSETAQVSALLTAYALAYPEVQWTLRSGGRVLLRSDGDGDLAGAAADLLGPDFADSLAAVDFEHPPYSARGLVSAPPKHWHNRTRQWYFVNRRPVTNKLLYKAVDDSVREFMSPGRFPAGVFFIELPPEELDANVHPAKAEVNFASPQQVYSLLTTALRRALGQAAAERQRSLTRGMALVVKPLAEPPLPASAVALERQAPLELAASGGQVDLSADADAYPETAEQLDSPALDSDAPSGQRAIPVYEMGRTFIAPAPLERPPLPPGEREIGFPTGFSVGAEQRSAHLSQPVDGRSSAPPLLGSAPQPREDALDAIQQVADTYLVLSTPGEVYLIDQHSAHERILFEQLWERIRARLGGAGIPRQRLLFPALIGLPPGEAALLGESLAAFQTLGFEVEPGAGATLIVHEVPALLGRYLTPELLQAVASDLADPLAVHHAHLGWAVEEASGPDTRGGKEPIDRTPNDISAGTPGSALSAALANRVKLLAATLACKAAVKAGQALSPSQRGALVREILARWSSLSCPHGRPTVIRLGPGELERMFLRS